MNQHLGLVSFVVRDYDEVLDFFVGKLKFVLIEDTLVVEQAKRWVVVAPPGTGNCQLLLAKASTAEQLERVGSQTGGRVAFFLSTDNFWRDFNLYQSQDIQFVREPRHGAVRNGRGV